MEKMDNVSKPCIFDKLLNNFYRDKEDIDMIQTSSIKYS